MKGRSSENQGNKDKVWPCLVPGLSPETPSEADTMLHPKGTKPASPRRGAGSSPLPARDPNRLPGTARCCCHPTAIPSLSWAPKNRLLTQDPCCPPARALLCTLYTSVWEAVGLQRK